VYIFTLISKAAGMNLFGNTQPCFFCSVIYANNGKGLKGNEKAILV